MTRLVINQLKIPYDKSNTDNIAKKLSAETGLDICSISNIKILKQSIDARKKPDIYYVYRISFEAELSKKALSKVLRNKNIAFYEPVTYALPKTSARDVRPIIIGMGPAGLFSAYILCLAGYKPIIFERGKCVEERTADIAEFWESGCLNPESNVQFGEGGAGAFSDGKLNTLVNDKCGRSGFVLETFVKFGAPENILYDAKPHIGTDILITVISNMRKSLIEMGAEIYFESRLDNIDIYQGDNASVISAIEIKDPDKSRLYDVSKSPVILAIGHSARDTFYMLRDKKVPMVAKEFAVGFRVEHPQDFINTALYGTNDLGPAPYKLTARSSEGRGVYSFCMCPGGYVVNSSSEGNRLVVNGMSYSKRDSSNANSAIVVSVGKDDYDIDDPLAGVEFQRRLEAKAYGLCSGKIPQQLLKDFKAGVASTGYGSFDSCAKGKCEFANLRDIYPDEINMAVIEGMDLFDRQLSGFNRPDCILSGIESRTSSPVRISRNEDRHSEINNLYPCGEGAGYAGGIMSAAMDGMKVAEAIIERF